MKIGFIGLGLMGSAMCGNIIRKSPDPVYCFDTVPEKTAELAAEGAIGCESAVQVAENSEIIITMVPKSEHSRAVYTSLLPVLHEGQTCIDMSTISPDVSVEISEAVKAAGADFADCPVVKSRPAALAGELGIYAGCSEETFDRILPVLRYMGSKIVRIGGNGMGLVMKLCHNTLVAQIQNGVNETLALAGRCGIDAYLFHEAVACGGAQNFYLDSQYENLARDNWTTAFSIENMHKDLGLTLDLASARGAKLPGAENAKRVYDKAMEQGLASSDFRTTYKVVREENE